MAKQAILYVIMPDPDNPEWGNLDLHPASTMFGRGRLLWHEVFKIMDNNEELSYARAKRDMEAWAAANGYEIVETRRAKR